VLCLAGASLRAEQTASRTPALTLDPSTKLDVTNAQIQWLDYRGRRALKLAPRTGHERDTDQEMFAVLTDSDFKDGVIEIDVAGARRAGYSTAEDVSGYKGIVGLTFRMQGDRAERFYIRPENSRLSNQLFRNRSTQYESSPDFPWQRLRQENPGVYESYADIESGAWTRLRIEVDGTKARLYVNGAAEPCLIVNDLKNGASSGKIALWARISSEAYFSNLRVTPKQSADSLKFSEVRNGSTEVVDYRGQRAVRLVPSPTTAGHDAYVLAVLAGSEFHDGTIETEIAGTPRPGAPADSRGFIGIAFRVQAHGDQSEIFYLRPTNGRADDQIRRNHSVQYESAPDYPWSRLRQENPGVYESYADLEAGAWTKVKIVVAGTTARLYVNGADQPSLVVNDLKRGDSHGQIALWSHVETDAYFGALHVSRQ
jgi:hypothetical protein